MTLRITASPNARNIRVTRPFSIVGLSEVTIQRIIAGGGSPTLVAVNDRSLLRSVLSQTTTDYQLRASTFGGAGKITPTYTSLNPDIATVNGLGFVTRVTDGSAVIRMSAGNQTRDITLNFVSAPLQTNDVFQGYVTGSLAHHVVSTIDGLLAGKSAANALRIFTSQDHAGQVYVRNPDCWAQAIPHCLTCLSPWNSTGGSTRAGTLISPRHILFAAHYQINVGATVRFVAMDGTVVNRTMTAKLTHPSYVPYFPDITVGVLDSDVPEPIAFARILPDNYEAKLPSQNAFNDGRLPTLTLDQEEKALVTDWYRELNSTLFTIPSNLQRLAFYEHKISGDSGNPAILPVNGLPVLLTVWTYGGAGSGSSVRAQKTAINAMMTQLGGGYQLTEIDLSGFPSY
jgi:hypothetical protein